MEESLTLLTIFERFYNFLFGVIFIGAGGLFFYLAFKNYLFAQSVDKIKETNKIIIYIVLGMIFLVASLFVPNLIVNFIGRRPTGTIPNAPIIRPTGTYTPFPF